MSSEEIESIYKKLVVRYANAYPRGDPLWVLNKHIEAYTRHVWKAKEPAIIDLALREGIEIPKVKELIEKGRTRKEGIKEVAKNMKFQVSKKKVKKWLEELEMQKAEKIPEQRLEQLIEEHEKSVEKLTTLFAKGEISEESYKIAVKKIEKDVKELRSGKEVSPVEKKPTPPLAKAQPIKEVVEEIEKESAWTALAKYFVHGLGFSLLLLGLAIMWAFILVSLVFLGFIIGAIIGVLILLYLVGFLNRALAFVIWGIETKSSFWMTLVHGFAFSVVSLIVGVPISVIYLVLPGLDFVGLAVKLIAFIIGAFADGYIGKSVASWFTE